MLKQLKKALNLKMTQRVAFTVALSWVSLSVPASASEPFALRIEDSLRTTLSATQQQQLQAFLSQGMEALPPSFKEAIPGPVTVKFLALGNNSDEIVPPTCVGDAAPADVHSGEVALGRYVKSGFFQKTYSIEMNRGFLAEIFKGEEGSRKYHCGHRSLYRLALATMLHELSHVYDFLNLPATQDPKEKALRDDCAISSEDPICQQLQRLNTTVSNRPAFRHLMGMTAGLSGSRSSNRLWARSPDPYEFTNTNETFAVNMEFFLLDPEFRCRRPAVFAFLSEHFRGFAPAGSGSCGIDPTVRFSYTNLPVSIDPDRIYQIHYFLAASGEDLSSRWGHAMFRIVTCAPGRPVGPDCIKDVGYHVVLSYRANINDVVMSQMDGVFGKYPSQLFLFSLPEVVAEYNLGESRDLISVPIQLSRDQIRKFAYKTMEQYWEYQGRYFFLGNNCATESLHFLQGVLTDSELLEGGDVNDAVETPKGVYATLRDRGLLDESVLARSDAKERYFFPGFRHQVAESYGMIQSALGAETPSLDDFIAKLSSADRRELYAKALESGIVSRGKLAVQFLFMELRIRESLKERLKSEAGRLIQDSGKSDSPELRNLAQQSVGLAQTLSPWMISRGGYGIPRDDERLGDGDLKTKIDAIYGVRAQLFDLTKKLLKDVFSDLDGVSANIQFFTSEVKADARMSPNP